MRKRVLGAFLFATFVGLAGPREAEACIWNRSHRFNPLPPCKIDDVPTRSRIMQLNTQVIGQLTTAAYHIRGIQMEIQQWRRAYDQATTYKNMLHMYYDVATANPLPSLVTAYNQGSPIAAYFQITLDGDMSLSVQPVDLRASADSIVQALRDTVAQKRLYANVFKDVLIADMHTRRAILQMRAQQRLKAMANHQQYVKAVSDSLKNKGDELAARYAGTGLPGGISEARITRLSAALSRLHGTSLDAQARALQAQMQAYTGSVDHAQRTENLVIIRHPPRM